MELAAVLISSVGTGLITGGMAVAGVRVNIQWLKQQQRDHKEVIDHIDQGQRSTEKQLAEVKQTAKRAHERIDHMEQNHD